ncbi:MAG: electron transport complex subunit RsxE [Clostridia bacterium]|jgi:Na+-transporting NADH:ubiquinone oxidoreductase subunit D|nr:electron transport complex subunit RsxE [Clostridia bacterium]MBN2883802.1 electron transport complex subunit RsxE [Clostridia bacterium]
MGNNIKTVFYRNLWGENPVIRQILGICSALAVTNRTVNSLVMGVGLMFVTAFSSLTLSALREHIPDRIRMIVQTLVIAAYVIIVDIFIKANLPEISKALGPYVGLIITNCIIMGRAEAFARKNPPVISFFDGLFAGIGYTVILLGIALIREILGFGTVFGFNINFIDFTKWTIMVVPPGAFFMIAIFIWIAAGIQNRRLKKKEAK